MRLYITTLSRICRSVFWWCWVEPKGNALQTKVKKLIPSNGRIIYGLHTDRERNCYPKKKFEAMFSTIDCVTPTAIQNFFWIFWTKIFPSKLYFEWNLTKRPTLKTQAKHWQTETLKRDQIGYCALYSTNAFPICFQSIRMMMMMAAMVVVVSIISFQSTFNVLW